MLFIDALDAWLAAKDLGFVSSIVDIALVAVAAGLIIMLNNRLVRYALDRQIKDKPPAVRKRLETAGVVCRGIVKYICLFIAGAVILGELGLKQAMNSLLAAAGVGGIILGVGAQSLIGDVAQGLFMLMESVMDIGDYVEINGVTGTVESLSLRSTVIKGYRGELNTLNNGQIKRVTNYTRGGYIALINMEIAYEADIPKARAIMREEAANYIAPADPTGNIVDYGVISLESSGVVLRIGVMVEDHMKHWSVERALRERIKARFTAEGVEIPYNKLVVIQHDPQ